MAGQPPRPGARRLGRLCCQLLPAATACATERPPAVEASKAPREAHDELVEAVIVGAGFSGMMLTYRLRNIGVTSIRSYEKGGDVGGTWYWNRYPGCACDVESYLYSYSFSPELEKEWSWSRRYGRQPEILEYARYTAEKFDLKRDVSFWTEVTSATYDESERLWVVRTDRGDRTRARFLFLANGSLSTPTIPNIRGVEKFKGASFHTHDWDHSADLAGKRVGVIGTGSTATQAIPVLAKVAKHLTVFQRTPAYCAPRNDRVMDRETEAQIKANYPQFRLGMFQATRGQEGGNAGLTDLEKAASAEDQDGPKMDGFAYAYSDLGRDGENNEALSQVLGPLHNPEANMRLQEHLRRLIAKTVKDPEVAKALMPHYALGCKRLCVVDDYWPTFNRDNVSLVDLKGKSITEVTERGPMGPDGTVYELDALVYATGFEMAGALVGKMDIRGRGGRKLTDKWRDGVATYLGMLTHGFPNMFIMVGPQSASVLSNMLNSIEHQASWFARLVKEVRAAGRTEVEASEEAEREWVRHCSDLTAKTVWGGVGGGCTSWYTRENLRVDGVERAAGGPLAPHQHVLPYTGGLVEYMQDVRTWATINKGLSPPPQGLTIA